MVEIVNLQVFVRFFQRLLFPLIFILSFCGCQGDPASAVHHSAAIIALPAPLVRTIHSETTQTPTQAHTTPIPGSSPDYEGPLSQDARNQLYQASLNEIAAPGQPAQNIVHRLRFLNGIDEDPSNACGPISASLLEAAGLLPDDFAIKNFWILNANPGFEGRIFLNKLFPEQDFFWYHTKIRTAKFDFYNHPLYAGDWLYLFGGTMGYDHMLTVTRRDSQGRVYSVTNSNTPQGFEINEYLLYDPASPQSGVLSTWNNARARGKFGTTGQGGFILIRKKDGTPESTWNGTGLE
jgi:hypothetical protein